ncbi:Aste57867_5583 [Aphanomyces stellatus]|uniref:Aste57867_5583 protein n=1 Tax=Aphanomyces stellatus TaxID=120398 RepID=A0A485KD10_9STRA|nr:hypothetical protein As57867_005570 [Aphanomyces stellatus]VFT82629.1 Aste57867_5583 [Aphanomyces stellatus]
MVSALGSVYMDQSDASGFNILAMIGLLDKRSLHHSRTFPNEDTKLIMVTTTDISKKLEAAFHATYVQVDDQSDGCGNKFSVILVSAAFEGQALLQRQRAVNEVLKEEMATIHALQMKTWTPAQFEQKKSQHSGEN